VSFASKNFYMLQSVITMHAILSLTMETNSDADGEETNSTTHNDATGEGVASRPKRKKRKRGNGFTKKSNKSEKNVQNINKKYIASNEELATSVARAQGGPS